MRSEARHFGYLLKLAASLNHRGSRSTTEFTKLANLSGVQASDVEVPVGPMRTRQKFQQPCRYGPSLCRHGNSCWFSHAALDEVPQERFHARMQEEDQQPTTGEQDNGGTAPSSTSFVPSGELVTGTYWRDFTQPSTADVAKAANDAMQDPGDDADVPRPSICQRNPISQHIVQSGF